MCYICMMSGHVNDARHYKQTTRAQTTTQQAIANTIVVYYIRNLIVEQNKEYIRFHLGIYGLAPMILDHCVFVLGPRKHSLPCARIIFWM